MSTGLKIHFATDFDARAQPGARERAFVDLAAREGASYKLLMDSLCNKSHRILGVAKGVYGSSYGNR